MDKMILTYVIIFPGGSDSKASAYNANHVGDPGSIPGSGRSPEEGNGNQLQYSCLENPLDGGAWWAVGHGVAESNTTEQLHSHYSNRKLGRDKGAKNWSVRSDRALMSSSGAISSISFQQVVMSESQVLLPGVCMQPDGPRIAML